MIEEALLNYGVLGLWTLSLIVERYKSTNQMRQIIENNTKALTKVYEVVSKCQKK